MAAEIHHAVDGAGPPTTWPRGMGIERPARCCWGTVMNRQLMPGLPMAAPTVAGMWMNGWRIHGAGLDQGDRVCRVLREAAGQHAAGRTRADHHVIEHLPVRRSSAFRPPNWWPAPPGPPTRAQPSGPAAQRHHPLGWNCLAPVHPKGGPSGTACTVTPRIRVPCIKLNETFSAGERQVPLNGSCEPRFEAVLEAFIQNYRSEDEVGSAVSVVVDGRTVVDLWGGWRDAAQAARMAARHDRLHDVRVQGDHRSGLQPPGRPRPGGCQRRRWRSTGRNSPRNGKETLPVRFVLDHRAGLPIVADPLWPGAIYDHDGHLRGTRRAGAAVGARARSPPTTSTRRVICSGKSCAA